MPPVTILSPYSGRPVKVREQDLGRALRDEQGRVFYVVEDPEHGRYAARTRKGSPKDLERYREIEAGVAKLDSDADRPAANLQTHDATGSKRRNPIGLLLIVVLIAAAAALGYIYLNYPGWLGLEGTEPATQEDADADGPSAEPTSFIKPAVPEPNTTATPIQITQPSASGAVVHTEMHRHPRASDPPLPDGMEDDPTPVYVSMADPPAPAAKAEPANTPKVLPIALPAPRARQTSYEDFRHTASGLRFKITHLTDGVSARAGHYVTIRYTASTLEGNPLINDASQSFILASGQAIRAFDEGLAGIREGEQLRLLVPRGHSDKGALPGIDRIPDEPFLLDVQLVSVKPGVTFVIESPGNIDSRVTLPGDTVDLHYLARVEGRDEVIDATIHRGEPMRITLGNKEVIPGLELGITGMRPGESRQLTIPPYLAYGKHSVAGGLIPENAVLSFRVTLVQIVEDDQ
ncbi:MAG: FKBP-type peptidyl-prolyl cis-trans isomerase [Planctomycetota bacterium]